MRRRLLKLGVFLLLGAIVNVAVAIGCMLWSPRAKDTIVAHGVPWPIPVESTWSSVANVYTRTSFGVTEYSARGRSVLSDDAMTIQYVLRVGWPCRFVHRSVCGIEYLGEQLVPASMWPPESWSEGIELPSFLRPLLDRRFLPIDPLWPGFAINTIFYAAMLWLLWIAAGKIRRFIRVKRHRCAACGYRIAEGVGPVCSECGHPLTRHAADAAQQQKT